MNDNFYFEFSLPTKCYCGEGALKSLPDVIAKLGKKILLVTSEELKGAIDCVNEVLAGKDFSVETFYIEQAEPKCAFIDSSAKKLADKKFDVIVGLGGGSAIDMAKALSIALTNEDSIWMYANLSNRPKTLPISKEPLPIIAIPTTSGTGSEVTPYTVLSNTETKQKGTVNDPKIFPMPPSLTALTGIDAFSHALEASINVSKDSPVSEVVGKESMGMIFETLPKAYKHPENLGERGRMAVASMLGGMAIAHRGTTTIHAIAEPLGALVGLPHSTSVAVTLLPVLEKTCELAPQALSSLYCEIFSERTASDKSQNFIDKIKDLYSSLEIKTAVKDYKSMEECKYLEDVLMDNVLKFKFRPLKQHPVEFDNATLKEIINKIIYS